MISWHWYVPAGVMETLGWLLLIWISWRFNRDLHRDIHDMDREVWVNSDTTNWKGWVRIR